MDWNKIDQCRKEHEIKERNAGKERYSLAEAIRSGRRMNMTYANPRLDELALIGNEELPHDDRDSSAREPGMLVSDAHSAEEVVNRRPWLKDPLLCQWCAEKIEGAKIMMHALEKHPDEVSPEEHVDWIEQIEDQPEMRASALAVFLRDGKERRAVLAAARRLNLSPSAFIAGALRFVLEHDLRVREDCGPLQ